jgi:hypothetical protein
VLPLIVRDAALLSKHPVFLMLLVYLPWGGGIEYRGPLLAAEKAELTEGVKVDQTSRSL